MLSDCVADLMKKVRIEQLKHGKRTKDTAEGLGLKPHRMYKILNGFADVPQGFERAFDELVSKWLNEQSRG